MKENSRQKIESKSQKTEFRRILGKVEFYLLFVWRTDAPLFFREAVTVFVRACRSDKMSVSVCLPAIAMAPATAGVRLWLLNNFRVFVVSCFRDSFLLCINFDNFEMYVAYEQ